MCDFVLLFVICLRLVRFEFVFGADVGVVIATIVNELAVDGEVHNLTADIVEKVLGMGCEDKTVRILGQVCL
jgi:hypothetical protein